MDEYVKSVKEWHKNSISFFSNKNKTERERWVLKEFLGYLPIEFDYSDIKAADSEPNDVRFKTMGFQVKEVMTEGVKRGDENKRKFESISDATEPKQLLEKYDHHHVNIDEAFPRMLSELKRHRLNKYHNSTDDINLLVYLNLSDTTYNSESPDLALVANELNRWKSVCVVTNNCAIVLRLNESENELGELRPGVLLFKN